MKAELLGKGDRSDVKGAEAILVRYQDGDMYVGVAEWLAKQLDETMLKVILTCIREALVRAAGAEGNQFIQPN